MRKNAMLLRVVGFAIAGLTILATHTAQAQNLAVPFDWQREWGTIHLNSYADGLNDPGIPATANGVVPCPPGANACSDLGSNGVTGGTIVHGIKYDIKNSVVNCASQQMPNCAFNNGGCSGSAPSYDRGIFSQFVCSMPSPSIASSNVSATPIGDPYTLVYMPMYDPRSNDDSNAVSNGSSGWQQLIINNCIRDIYANDPGAGAFSPVGHVFTAAEKNNWYLANGSKGIPSGAQIPSSYYYYQQKSDNSWVFSVNSPKNGDYVAGTLSAVDNYSSNLAAIKAYKLADNADSDNFIIVDPNPFFNMNNYAYTGSPEPYANCPVLGLKMYDGICDPNGVAGCNLPVYGVGPSTTFTGQSGSTATFNNYPVMWSGYVTSWAFITPDQYWSQVSGRVDVNGSNLYVQAPNSNPVLRVTRAASYCTNEEMTSDPNSGVADLPCVQYLQYATDGSHAMAGSFVDLYNPSEDASPSNDRAAYVVKHDYNLKADGTLASPVLDSAGVPVTFFDKDATYTTATGVVTAAIENVQAVTNSAGVAAPGSGNTGGGSGVHFSYGTSIALQLNDQTVQWRGQPVNCLEFTNAPNNEGGKDIFIPTNTLREYQSFVTAVENAETFDENGKPVVGNLGGYNIYGQACPTEYKPYSADNNGTDPNGTQTWYGTTSCSQIPAPSCNEVTTISAQRYCLRATGLLGDCSECAGDSDPDQPLDPGPSGEILKSASKSKNSTNSCYFQANCFSTSACPGLVSGGHVFCLSPDTKIMMADGTEKAIVDIKAGDVVMAFDAKHSRGILKTAKVKATAVTKDQKLVQINDLKITPLHKIILANGRAVKAKEIKVGDKILRASGKIETVTTVTKDLPPITVYNLSLDGADGYVAGGVRVLEYPLADGLVK